MDQQVPDAMDILQIMARLPHRYPMLLIDRILALAPGQGRSRSQECVYGRAFFSGHFPGHPVMPAALVLEAMAQVGAVLVSCAPTPPVTSRTS